MTQEKALQALHDENERLALYKDAYAQPEQEPVAYLCEPDANGLFGLPTPDKGCKDCFPVYRHSQRTWVGLTDKEIDSYFEDHGWSPSEYYYPVIKDIEDKLRERNT